ncbi:MAG: DMT family transporter [Desulfobacterales bacterium]|nr:MAG: DMT family transporter [Desulfobacterales bacterium]
MRAAALALLSSIMVGVATLLMKKGIEKTNPTSAMLVVTLVGAVIFAGIALVTIPWRYLGSDAVPFFVLAGIFSPALVRWLYFISLDRVGPSVSSSIIAAGPAFTAIIAYFLLHENLTVPIGLGTVLIVTGIVIFERQINSAGQPALRRRKDLIFPLISALLLGFAVILRKKGLNILNSPLLGVTVGFVTSLLFYSVLCGCVRQMRASIALKKDDILYLAAAGAFLSVSWLTLFYALSLGQAVVVAPLSSLHPLVVVAISYFWLGNKEKISKKTFLGTSIVVAGVLLITMG